MEPGRPVTGIVQILKKSKLDMAQIKDAALAHELKRWMRPEPPEPIRGQMIWSNPTCIIFGCFPEQDGPTEIAIG